MIHIGNPLGSYGAGDTLILTAIAKQNPNVVVDLPPNASRFQRFFRDLCEVNITDSPRHFPNKYIPGMSYVKMKLEEMSLDVNNELPFILFNSDELSKIDGLNRLFAGSTAFKPNCSNNWKHIRQNNPSEWNRILAQKKQNGERFWQFASIDNCDIFDTSGAFINLSIEDLCVYYAAIKSYLGVDTFDYHLMLACGGRCEVHYPINGCGYSPIEWHYNSEKVKYIPYSL